MKTTFFEAISLADREKVHSHVIAWILNNPIISNIDKTAFLNGLVQATNKPFQRIQCQTEVTYLDILIEADQEVFVIENKIKAIEGHKQLQKYSTYLEKHFKDERKVHCIYLTLINEGDQTKEVSDHSVIWKNITYETLADNAKKSFVNLNGFEGEIVQDWTITLDNLSKCFKFFIAEPSGFPMVFENDYQKPKYPSVKDKNNTELAEYIRTNRLESIFRRAFALKYIKAICKAINYDINKGEINKVGTLEIILNPDLDVFSSLELDFHLRIELVFYPVGGMKIRFIPFSNDKEVTNKQLGKRFNQLKRQAIFYNNKPLLKECSVYYELPDVKNIRDYEFNTVVQSAVKAYRKAEEIVGFLCGYEDEPSKAH